MVNLIRNQASIDFLTRCGYRLTAFSNEKKGVEYFYIHGNIARQVEFFTIGEKRKWLIIDDFNLSQIYSRIKHVYDQEGVLIARRDKIGAPLRLTSKGFAKQRIS